MPFTQQELQALTPANQQVLSGLVATYGDNAARVMYENMLQEQQAPAFVPDPRVPGSVPPRLQIETGAKARATTEGHLQIVNELVRQGMDPTEAKEAAKEQLRGIIGVPRTARGTRMEGAARPGIETMEPTAALVEAFKPQPLIPIEQQEAYKDQERFAKEQLNRTVGSLRAQAAQDVDARGVHTGAARDPAIDGRFTVLAKQHLEDQKQVFDQRARHHYYSQPGVQPFAEGHPQKATQDEEIRQIGQALWQDYREKGFGDVRIPGEVQVEASLTDSAKEFVRDLLVTETAEGIPYETPLAAGMRGLGGLVRPITKAAIDAISFEVDADGNPLDTEDINYQLWQMQEEALDRIHQGEASIFDYAAAATGFLPTSMEAKRTLGERPEMSTGSYTRDLALSIAHGRSLGDDAMELSASKHFWTDMGMPTAPFWFGLGIEIALPITPIPVLKPAIAGSLRVSARAADLGAEALEAGAMFASNTLPEAAAGTAAYAVQAAKAARKGSEAVKRGVDAVTDPYALLRKQILYREAEAIMKGISGGERAAPRATTPARMAEAMAMELAAAVIAGKPPKMPIGSEASAVVAELGVTLAKTREALKGKKLENLKRYGDDPQGQEVVDEIRKTTAAGYWADEVPFEVLRNIADRRLREHFANLVPDDYIQVSPYTMVSRKAFKLLKKSTDEGIGRIVKSVVVDGKIRYARPIEVAKAVVRELGVAKIAKTARATNIIRALKKGEDLSDADRMWVHGIVQAHVWKKASAEAADVSFKGQAFTRAAEPTIRRLSVLRNAQLIHRGVRAALKKGLPKPVKVKGTSRSPVEVTDWLDRTHRSLIGLDTQFANKMGRYADEFGAGEGIDKMMDDLFKADPLDEQDIAQSLAQVVKLFFGDKLNIPNIRLDDLLRDAGIKTFDREGVFAAIEEARRLQPDLAGAGLGARFVGGDDVFAAIATWGMEKTRLGILAKATDELASQYPELLWHFGRREGEEALLKEALVTAGIPEAIAIDLKRIAAEIEPASRKEVIDQMMASLWIDGKASLTVNMEETARLVELDVSKIIFRTDKMTRVLKKHLLKEGIEEGSPVFDARLKELRATTIKAYTDTLTDLNAESLAGKMSSLGLGVGNDARPLGFNFYPEALVLPGRRAVFVDPDTAKLAKQLLDDSVTGKLQTNLNTLRLRDKELAEFVGGHIWSFYNGIRRGSIGGMLGGTLLPSSRFLGVNVVSAPFIVAITAPGYAWAAVKAIPDGLLGRGAQAAKRARVPGFRNSPSWMKARSAAKADDVVLETPDGQMWTKKMMEEAIERNNIRFSQVSFEFGDAILEDIRRMARVDKHLKEASWVQSAIRWLDPRRKNIWNTWTEQSDMAFREAVFREALIRGESEQVAAELARNALLDYGAIGPKERATAARFFLFYAFMRKNSEEVATAFVRDPGGVRNLRRIAVWTKEQHEQAGTWVTEPDYARNRLWARMGKEYDEVLTGHYGPEIPALIPFSMMMNGLYGMYDLNSWNWRRVVQELKENVLQTPIYAHLKDLEKLESTPTAPDGMVDPRYVVLWQSTGMWSSMQKFLDIEIVPRGRMKAGESVFKEGDLEVQYRFGSPTGSTRFINLKRAAISMGMDRNIRDWTSTLIRAGAIGADEETSFKRHGDGTWWLYALSLDTPMKAPSYVQTNITMARELERELRGLAE